MILRRLTMKNFLSHKDTQIEFPFGVTVLAGPNGAGKTSIIDAIFVALFNTKPRGEGFSDLIRYGAREARVELEFEEGGVPYRIVWKRKKGHNSLGYELYRADRNILIAHGVSAVKAEVENIIGIDRDSAVNSTLIRQGEITSLLDQAPAKRKELIGKLLGLERLEKAWQFMKEVIDHFEETTNDLDKKIAEIKGELKSKSEQREKLKQEIQELDEKIKELKQKLEDLREQLDEIQQELNELEEKEERYNKLMLKLTKVTENIKFVQERINRLGKDLNESKEAKEKLKKLEEEIRKIPLLDEYIEWSDKFEELNTKKEQLESDLNKISTIRNKVNEAMGLCMDYVGDIEVSKEFKEIPIDLSEIERSTMRISTLVKSIVAQIERDRKELKSLISEALRFLPEPTIEAKEKKLQEHKKGEKMLENRISKLENKRGEVAGRINELKQALDMLGESETCPVCKTKLTPEHRDRVKYEMQREIETLEERLEQVKRDIKKAKYQKRKIKEEIERVSKINVERIKQLQEGIESKKKELGEHYKELQRIMTGLKDLENDIRPKISNIESKIKEIEEKLNELIKDIGHKPEDPKNELRELRKKKEEYDRLKPIADKYEEILHELEKEQRELANLKEEMSKIEEEIKKLGYDKKRHEELKERYADLSRKYEGVKATLKEKEDSLERKSNELRELEMEIQKLKGTLDSLNKKLNKIKTFIGDLKRVRNSYHKDGVQKLLRKKITPLLSELATEYIESFNMDITDVYLSEDFDISVIKGSVEVPISLLSGGEKVAVGLALRLAIAKALSRRLSVVIMDEPTTHLDEERRKDLVNILGRFFKNEGAIPQIVIVTHHQELETVADTLYMVRKVEDVSQVQEVESLGREV